MKIAKTSGNWNDPNTWENCLNVSTLSTATNINLSTTSQYSPAFTPGSMTTVTGLVVFPVSGWSGRNITFTLQAGGVDTMMSVTVSGADVSLNQPLYLRLPVNYIAAAGVALRWRAVTSAGSCSIAQSSTASQFAAITSELVNAVPSSEMVMICALNAVTSVTVTITDTAAAAGTNAVASGSGGFATSPRWWDMGLQISGSVNAMANLTFSPTANTVLTMQNSAWCFNNTKVTQKPNSSFTSRVDWTPGATIGTANLWWYWSTGSQCDIQGKGLSANANWKTKFTSGLGTAASPAIVVNGTDISVGDYLVFHPTGNGSTNYNETEYRYVISKPTTNSVVLSNTSGGTENALIYQHTNGYVFNATGGKSVIWKSTDTRTWHMLHQNTSATNSNTIMRWILMSDLFASGSSARGGLCPALGQPLLEYISLGTPGQALISQQMYVPSNNQNSLTFTGIFAFNASGANAGDGVISVIGINKTFTDCWIIDSNTRAWNVTGSNATFNRCGSIANGKGSVAGLYFGWAINGANALQMNDCETHSCRYGGMLFYPGGVDNVAVRYISGTLGLNASVAVEQGANSPGYNTFYFESPTIAETTYVNNNNLMLFGSKVTMNDVNGTAYNSYVFATDGVEQYTGSGVTDTTTSPLGFRTQRLAPINTTGFKYRYEQLANPNQIFTTYGRAWVNAAALADAGFSVTVDLYLPGVVEGVDTPSATTTMTKTSTANSANAQYLLSAFYSGTRPLFATIVVTAKNNNNVASAYAYVADILNGTNNITNQSTERRGTTSPIMFEQNGDSNAVAAAVWADTQQYGVGSKGRTQKNTDLSNLLIRDGLS